MCQKTKRILKFRPTDGSERLSSPCRVRWPVCGHQQINELERGPKISRACHRACCVAPGAGGARLSAAHFGQKGRGVESGGRGVTAPASAWEDWIGTLGAMAGVARCPCAASSSSPSSPRSWPHSRPRASVPVQSFCKAACRPCVRSPLIGFRVSDGAPVPSAGTQCRRRSTFRVSASQGAEKSFKTTVELDKLIDTLRGTESTELPKVVLENVMSFDSPFWLRLATRADMCKSVDDAKDYEDLAFTIMNIVEKIVKKTQEKIESSTDVLKSLLTPIVEASGEILWPPRDPQSLVAMRKEIQLREQGSFLDESFLSEVNAQMRQAKEDGDKPGLVAILQKVLQYYASAVLSNRSYAVKDGQVDKAEELLESVLSADEDNWESLLRSGLDYGGGEVAAGDLVKVIEKRVERTLMRTENGTYQQRVLVEYIREVENRAQSLADACKKGSA